MIACRIPEIRYLKKDYQPACVKGKAGMAELMMHQHPREDDRLKASNINTANSKHLFDLNKRKVLPVAVNSRPLKKKIKDARRF